MTREAQGREPQHEKEKPTVVYFDLMRHANRYAGEGKWIDPVTGEEIKFNPPDKTPKMKPVGTPDE